MKQRIPLLLAMAALVSITSCKKDKEATPKSKTELLTAKNWRFSSMKYTIGAFTIDGMAGMEDCEKNNFFKFNADKTVIYDEGPTKCESSDPQTEQGSWDITTNDTKFVLDGDEFELVELSASTLHVKATEAAGDGQTATIDLVLNSF